MALLPRMLGKADLASTEQGAGADIPLTLARKLSLLSHFVCPEDFAFISGRDN